MLAFRKVRRKLRMGTICSPNPSGTKTLEVCNADWMASLPSHLHNVPLSNLAIPSCPTLCNPIDGSPPGSPVPGILQLGRLIPRSNKDSIDRPLNVLSLDQALYAASGGSSLVAVHGLLIAVASLVEPRF